MPECLLLISRHPGGSPRSASLSLSVSVLVPAAPAPLLPLLALAAAAAAALSRLEEPGRMEPPLMALMVAPKMLLAVLAAPLPPLPLLPDELPPAKRSREIMARRGGAGEARRLNCKKPAFPPAEAKLVSAFARSLGPSTVAAGPPRVASISD